MNNNLIVKGFNVNEIHGQAVNAILPKLDIAGTEKETLTYVRYGHVGTTTQYTKIAIDKVRQWINDNTFPVEIISNDKAFKVTYSKEVAASC